MTAFERVHAALDNTRDLLRKLQQLLELPFMPKQGLVVTDGFEAINEISNEMEHLRRQVERARGTLQTIGQAYQLKPNSDLAILDQCVSLARATLEELK